MKKKKNHRTENERSSSDSAGPSQPTNEIPVTNTERSVSIPSPDESSIIETISSPPGSGGNENASPFDARAINILHQRAIELSQSQQEISAQPFIELVILGIRDELYAFRTHAIHEIRLLEDLTPVPCTPNFILGVTNIRGLIYSIVDLGRFLDLESVSFTDNSRLILVGHEGIELGFLVDRVIEKVDIRVDQLIRSATSIRGMKDENVEGIFTFQNKMVIVIDIFRLLKDERILISEQVS